MAIIIPEIYKNLITEKVKGLVKISSYAQDLGEVGNFAEEGDSITFPQFSALSDAEILVKGDGIKTEELKQTSTKKTVKHYCKGVSIYDIDAKTGMGNFQDNAVMQQARIFAKARDKECVADILANTLLKSSTENANSITNTELDNALNLWGDKQDSDSFDAIIINSRLLPSFLSMGGFVSNTLTYTKDANGIVRQGVVGFYRGIKIVLSDVGTYDTTANECITFILKKQSLGVKDKKDGVDIEVSRDAEHKKDDIFADEIFVIGLIDKIGRASCRERV